MPALRSLLADLAGNDEARAQSAASALARRGAEILPALARLLASPRVDDRWWAVRTLAEMKEPRLDWLVAALGDDSSEVRAAAALAISAHPVEAAVPALTAALSDQDSVVAALAVRALVVLGPLGVPALLDSYGSATAAGKIQIMRALAEIKDARAIPLMMKAVESGSALVQHWASEGLDRLGLDMVYMMPE